MKEVLDKLEKMDEKLDEMKITQVMQQSSLDHHIKRTDLLEDYIKPTVKDFNRRKAFWETLEYYGKKIVLIGTVVGAIAGILVYFK